MVMQDPMTSLNPLKTVGAQICEALTLPQGMKGEAAKQKATEILEDVGIKMCIRDRSAASLLAYAKYLKDTGRRPGRRVYVDCTVFEEVGHGGAVIPQDVVEMLSVDMGCVGTGLQCDETMVSICVMDSKGPSHKAVVDGLVEAALRAGVRYALDVYPHYSSDADVAVCAGNDVRHCVVGAGVYASHGYERSHIEGLANTFDLLNSYIETAD